MQMVPFPLAGKFGMGASYSLVAIKRKDGDEAAPPAAPTALRNERPTQQAPTPLVGEGGDGG